MNWSLPGIEVKLWQAHPPTTEAVSLCYMDLENTRAGRYGYSNSWTNLSPGMMWKAQNHEGVPSLLGLHWLVFFFFSLLENIFFILLSVCLSAYLFLCGVCVFACMPCMAPVCQPEGKFQESLLSSHHVCSGNKTQGIQPDSKHLPLPAEPPYQPLNTDSSARSFWNPSKSQRLGWNNSSLVPKRVYVSGTNNL